MVGQKGVSSASRVSDMRIFGISCHEQECFGHLVSRKRVFGESLVTDRSNSEYLGYIVGQTGVSRASRKHGQEYFGHLVSRTGVFWASRFMDRSI